MSSELRWAPFATQTRTSLFRYARRHPHVPSSAVAAIPSKASCTQTRYREASTPEARRRQGSAFRERVNRELRRNDPAGRRAAFVRRRRTVPGSCGKRKGGKFMQKKLRVGGPSKVVAWTGADAIRWRTTQIWRSHNSTFEHKPQGSTPTLVPRK